MSGNFYLSFFFFFARDKLKLRSRLSENEVILFKIYQNHLLRIFVGSTRIPASSVFLLIEDYFCDVKETKEST